MGKGLQIKRLEHKPVSSNLKLQDKTYLKSFPRQWRSHLINISEFLVKSTEIVPIIEVFSVSEWTQRLRSLCYSQALPFNFRTFILLPINSTAAANYFCLLH